MAQRGRRLRGMMLPAALAAAGVLLLARRSRRFAVEGRSMAPTLEPGDWLVVTPLPRWGGGLRRGWLVVARRPDRPEVEVVKRVAAVGEDEAVTLLGDNPAASTDSRQFGAVPASAVVGGGLAALLAAAVFLTIAKGAGGRQGARGRGGAGAARPG